VGTGARLAEEDSLGDIRSVIATAGQNTGHNDARDYSKRRELVGAKYGKAMDSA
jgi:hypothetical protein